jgi:uncharacterized spore protein YtfJ
MTTVEEVMEGTREVMTVRRVFGEPVERGALTVIPVATVRGGGGGGQGEAPPTMAEGETTTAMGTGSGGGFGVTARPVGAYVIREDSVTWKPAVDLGKVASIALAGLITIMIGRALRRPRPVA